MPAGGPLAPPAQVYGHRGSRRPGPENTPAAVRAALLAGADGVEVDIRRDPTGLLVVSHDPVLWAAGSAPAGAVTPPALPDILDAARNVPGEPQLAGRRATGVSGAARVICEVKNRPGDPDYDAVTAATARALLGLLGARRESDLLGAPPPGIGDRGIGDPGIGDPGIGDPGIGDPGIGDNVVISSFDGHSLALVRALGGPPTAVLTPPGAAVRAGIAYALEHGHAELHPHWASVTARGVLRAHAAGLRVVPWTVTSAARARRLASLGVDALICDDPAAVVSALWWDSADRVGFADNDA